MTVLMLRAAIKLSAHGKAFATRQVHAAFGATHHFLSVTGGRFVAGSRFVLALHLAAAA
jgi:hypothetical protein